MRFLSPQAFLLLPLLIAVAWYTWKIGVRQRSRVYFPTDAWIAKRPRFRLPSPFKVYFFLRLIALLLIVYALARPQSVFQKTSRTVEAVEMIICFDLSKSMEAIDFTPNRHVVAINTITQFIDKRIDDRIGLVLFSGEAYLAVPLTQDHDVLKNAVVTATNKNLEDGTAIGQALAVGVHHLRYSKAKSRIMILVTDGDNNMGSVDPLTAAELGKGYGVKIYTIGIGKKGRVAFPVRRVDAFGREYQEMQYLTDAVNDELLAEIAKQTGGQSYHAEDPRVLGKIFSTIDTLEKTKVQTQSYVRYTELAWPWILAACLLLLCEGLALNTRWRKLP